MSKKTAAADKKKRESLSATVLRWRDLYNVQDPITRTKNAFLISDQAASLLAEGTHKKDIIAEVKFCDASAMHCLLRLRDLDKDIRTRAIARLKKWPKASASKTAVGSAGVSRTHLLALTRADKTDRLNLFTKSCAESWSLARLRKAIAAAKSVSIARPKLTISGIRKSLAELTDKLDKMEKSGLEKMNLVKKRDQSDTLKELDSAIEELSTLKKNLTGTIKKLKAAKTELEKLIKK